jgi:hypothetical protein
LTSPRDGYIAKIDENLSSAASNDAQRETEYEMSKENEARCSSNLARRCAQAVAGVFHEECGLDRETALRMASGFAPEWDASAKSAAPSPACSWWPT